MNSNNVSSSPTDYAYVQWLTVENLAKHTSSTPPPEVTRAERIAQFQASLIGTNEGILTRRTTRVSFPPRGKSSKRSRDTSCSGNSNNIAIDVFPLPFPYHNDAFFLPVVESGHTRYDSSSRAACSVLAATPVSDRRSQRTSSSSINSFIINLSSSPSSRPARPSSFLPHPNNRSSSTPPNLLQKRESCYPEHHTQYQTSIFEKPPRVFHLQPPSSSSFNLTLLLLLDTDHLHDSHRQQTSTAAAATTTTKRYKVVRFNIALDMAQDETTFPGRRRQQQQQQKNFFVEINHTDTDRAGNTIKFNVAKVVVELLDNVFTDG
ncbi:hypothetical protein VTP01DRAFT_10422 [Rhizomucor pusillus]|uniref:uncharacterized protein n=1 Tax=Rhizomucor pusillus TaxID=4840 RepID=UPI003742C32C